MYIFKVVILAIISFCWFHVIIMLSFVIEILSFTYLYFIMLYIFIKENDFFQLRIYEISDT